jgi:hypothetical protein
MPPMPIPLPEPEYLQGNERCVYLGATRRLYATTLRVVPQPVQVSQAYRRVGAFFVWLFFNLQLLG